MKKLIVLALAAGAFAAVPLWAQDTASTVRQSGMDSTAWRTDSIAKQNGKTGRTTVDSAGGDIVPTTPTPTTPPAGTPPSPGTPPHA